MGRIESRGGHGAGARIPPGFASQKVPSAALDPPTTSSNLRIRRYLDNRIRHRLNRRRRFLRVKKMQASNQGDAECNPIRRFLFDSWFPFPRVSVCQPIGRTYSRPRWHWDA